MLAVLMVGLEFLLFMPFVTAALRVWLTQYEQQRYDGWYNNLAHPAWGAVDSHLTRKERRLKHPETSVFPWAEDIGTCQLARFSSNHQTFTHLKQ